MGHNRPPNALESTALALAVLGASVTCCWEVSAQPGDVATDEPDEVATDEAATPDPSPAEPGDARLIEARAHFREGLALMTAGDFAAARGKFQAVAEVRMTAQVAFNLAECEAHLGMLRVALGNYRLASSAASDGSAPKVAGLVQARIADVEARIAHLTLRRGPGAAGATITLDGLELGAKELEAGLPVDPGSHVVVMERGGRELARRTFTLEEGQTESIVLEAATTGQGGDQAGERSDPVSDGASPMVGVVLIGAGAVSLGAGVVFLVLRQGKVNELDEVCSSEGSCPPSAESTSDQGRLFTGLAEVTIPLGIVGVAAGVILLATSGSDDATAGPVHFSPGVAGVAADGPLGGATATWLF